MKKFMSRLLLVLVAAVLGTVLLAQTGPTEPLPVPTKGWQLPDWLNWYNALYGAIVVLITYVSGFIPGLKKITEIRLRVIVIGIATGVIFFVNGQMGFWDIASGFLTGTGFYTYILRWIFPTPGTRELPPTAKAA